ncbi:MAG: thioredoxin domain-containing protein [Candidatus Pacebacteria bacterium]|nr:thioredoxin domain-containing protein [Candidatus Paceibacterota bacterium]
MEQTKSSGFIEKYLTPIAVIVGAGIIALAFMFGQGGGAKPGAQQPAIAVDVKDVKTDGVPFIGSPTAPATLVVWFDYQCPFCKQFEQTITPQLIENYVKTGKLKIVFKDFQFLGEDSVTASLFAHAVWESSPESYHEWLTAVMDAQDDEGDQGFGDLASIEKVTKEKVPAIDTEKVKALMVSKKAEYTKSMNDSRAEGSSFGINGTPSVIVGTKLLSGAVPYATIAAAIDESLKK